MSMTRKEASDDTPLAPVGEPASSAPIAMPPRSQPINISGSPPVALEYPLGTPPEVLEARRRQMNKFFRKEEQLGAMRDDKPVDKSKKPSIMQR